MTTVALPLIDEESLQTLHKRDALISVFIDDPSNNPAGELANQSLLITAQEIAAIGKSAIEVSNSNDKSPIHYMFGSLAIRQALELPPVASGVVALDIERRAASPPNQWEARFDHDKTMRLLKGVAAFGSDRQPTVAVLEAIRQSYITAAMAPDIHYELSTAYLELLKNQQEPMTQEMRDNISLAVESELLKATKAYCDSDQYLRLPNREHSIFDIERLEEIYAYDGFSSKVRRAVSRLIVASGWQASELSIQALEDEFEYFESPTVDRNDKEIQEQMFDFIDAVIAGKHPNYSRMFSLINSFEANIVRPKPGSYRIDRFADTEQKIVRAIITQGRASSFYESERKLIESIKDPQTLYSYVQTKIIEADWTQSSSADANQQRPQAIVIETIEHWYELRKFFRDNNHDIGGWLDKTVALLASRSGSEGDINSLNRLAKLATRYNTIMMINFCSSAIESNQTGCIEQILPKILELEFRQRNLIIISYAEALAKQGELLTISRLLDREDITAALKSSIHNISIANVQEDEVNLRRALLDKRVDYKTRLYSLAQLYTKGEPLSAVSNEEIISLVAQQDRKVAAEHYSAIVRLAIDRDSLPILEAVFPKLSIKPQEQLLMLMRGDRPDWHDRILDMARAKAKANYMEVVATFIPDTKSEKNS